jgi:rhodanese-related sulfurtransferase
LRDGERISLGDVQLEIRHTPGHTPESISVVVWEHADDDLPYGVLTGDALFIGDVGRPDLLASLGFTRDELADQLYDSLHGQLLTLPDATRVYPAHGAGSACGKNLSTETWSTIGDQRRDNYALLAPDKQTFIDLVTEGQPPAPSYFVYDAVLNRKDRPLLDETAPLQAMDLGAALRLVDDGAVLLDGRSPEEFARGHVIGSINVGLEGRYAEFAGSVLPSDVDIVLLVEPGFEIEARNRLARIGFDRVAGYVDDPLGAMAAAPTLTQRASRLTVGEFDLRRAEIDGLQIVDIRNPGETALGTVPGAATVPVGQLPGRLAELDPTVPTVVYCAGGYRSSVAASLLRAEGFDDVSDVLGGFGAWLEVTNASRN